MTGLRPVLAVKILQLPSRCSTLLEKFYYMAFTMGSVYSLKQPKEMLKKGMYFELAPQRGLGPVDPACLPSHLKLLLEEDFKSLFSQNKVQFLLPG